MSQLTPPPLTKPYQRRRVGGRDRRRQEDVGGFMRRREEVQESKGPRVPRYRGPKVPRTKIPDLRQRNSCDLQKRDTHDVMDFESTGIWLFNRKIKNGALAVAAMRDITSPESLVLDIDVAILTEWYREPFQQLSDDSLFQSFLSWCYFLYNRTHA